MKYIYYSNKQLLFIVVGLTVSLFGIFLNRIRLLDIINVISRIYLFDIYGIISLIITIFGLLLLYSGIKK